MMVRAKKFSRASALAAAASLLGHRFPENGMGPDFGRTAAFARSVYNRGETEPRAGGSRGETQRRETTVDAFAIHQRERAAVIFRDLTAEHEADAAALGLGGEE